MYNKVVLIGNIARDIELKYTPSGLTIANTAIATSRKYKSSNGEQKEEVMFVDIAFFGRTAEAANQYLRKGSKLLVEGRLKLDQWTDANAQKRSKHSVTVDTMQMLDNKRDRDHITVQQGSIYGGEVNPPIREHQQKQQVVSTEPELSFDESEIPF